MPDPSTYIPRLTDAGIRNNRLWYDDNPFYVAGFGLPNCTCYAWGRFWEIGGGTPDHRPTLSGGNAEDWFSFNDGYERGTTPALGSVICFADGPFSGDGHVAIVEIINDDKSIVVSESAYDGYFFQTETLRPENNWVPHSAYRFQGFIYNPYSGDTPIPVGSGFKWWLSKNVLYRRKENAI